MANVIFRKPKTADEILFDAKRSQLAAIEQSRKDAEAYGVNLNGIRYAGDPSNRQALSEVLDLADATGMTIILAWKDSDGGFHSDHPVADVRQALLDIAARRGNLIAQEGALAAQIAAAETVEAVEAITWEG